MAGDQNITDADTVEEMERQARDQQAEEEIAGALKDVNDLFNDGPTENDRYQDRERDRQSKFNQMFNDADPEETGTYLDNHHEWEKVNSDGNGDT